jgi:hypothetical protein
VFSKLLLGTLCICVFRSRSIVSFALFFNQSSVLYTHSQIHHLVSTLFLAGVVLADGTCFICASINQLVRLCLQHLSDITCEKLKDKTKMARQGARGPSSNHVHDTSNQQLVVRLYASCH